MRLALVLLGPALAAIATAAEVEVVLANPTGQAWTRAAMRLPTPLPKAFATTRGGRAPTLVATRDGTAVPCAAVEEDGAWWAVVLDDLAAESLATYRIASGPSKAAGAPAVRIAREGDFGTLDNGRIAIRVPLTAAAGACPGPIAAIRLGEAWVGESRWHGAPPCTAFTSDIVADGQVTAVVRLRWDFAAKAGINGDVPAFAEVVLRLDPGADHVEVQERHTMPRGARWNLLLAKGWSPTQGLSQPHGQGAGASQDSLPAPDRPLAPIANVSMRPDLFLSLVPRWNQHFKDGWRAAVSDGTQALGAVAVSAGRWVWPHDNAIELSVAEGGHLRLPCQRGRRVWWLMAGPVAQAGAPGIDYLQRWAWQHPARVGGLISDFPGAKGGWSGANPYDGVAINPTGPQRQMGRAALKDALAGKVGDRSTLTRVQDWLHPDIYGSSWLGWSPENPNFFSDFSRPAIAWTAQLKAHPRFAELRQAAEDCLRQDMYHSVTLPGGAGQECPGYLTHALGLWGAPDDADDKAKAQSVAAICVRDLGFDPRTWDRYLAAKDFLRRISQPDGAIRRALPMGDTHPDRVGGGPTPIAVDAATAAGWPSQEFPGFGAILRHRPGTPQETYLAFKAGPNRGHYHGDQLALHWCSAAAPLAVDHHCSYKPRAGQEHMHNRLSFATKELPSANMDGYERLIGFATGATADIAVGEVSSRRLRAIDPLPPERWHQEYPQQDLGGELRYRRTVVLLKNPTGVDAVVLRDQWWAPMPLTATFNLHTRATAPAEFAGRQTTWKGRLVLMSLQSGEATPTPFTWSHENGGTETTNGVRLAQTAATGEFVTVLWPADDLPATSYADGRLRVGAREITFAASGAVTVAGGTTLAAIDLERNQGDIGLFVPDAGYPFGEIPDWLIRQRWKLQPFAPAWAERMRDERP